MVKPTSIMNNRLFDNIIYLIFRSGMSPMEHHGNALQKYDSNGKYKRRQELMQSLRENILPERDTLCNLKEM